MSSPKKNVAYDFYISLIDSADTGTFKAAPTIAAGDFQVSGDGAAFANLATLPVVDPAGSIGVKVSLSAAEMNFDKIMVQCIDAAGAEWDDVLIFIDATAVNVDDVVRSTNPGNTLDIDASNRAGSDVQAIDGSVQRATDLAEIAQYLIANSAEPITNYVADDSLLAKMLAADGDISAYDDQVHSQEAIAVTLGGTGTGARTVAVTVDDGAAVLENAIVRFTEGANTYAGPTNASGQISFSLDLALV